MKILIVAGGTGGHIFPAIALTEEIKLRKIASVLFVSSGKKQDIERLRSKNIDFRVLPIIPLNSKGILSILNFIIRLIAGTAQSIFILLTLRPGVVVGFGSFFSVPMVLIASLLRIKTLIHEQNVYPGKANRILAGFVDKIAISFSESEVYFKKFNKKLIVSGNPLRQGLLKRSELSEGSGSFPTPHEPSGKNKKKNSPRAQLNLDPIHFTMLIIGGSQGAHILNDLVPRAIGLIELDKKKALKVIHISGAKEKDDVIKAYKDIGIKSDVFPFTEDMARIYNECDFVISRAGAMTISELAALRKPAILIPYPYAEAHQRLNAKVLEKIGGAVLLEQKNLNVEVLSRVILKFMDRGMLTEMSKKIDNVEKMDACEVLIKAILEYGNSKFDARC